MMADDKNLPPEKMLIKKPILFDNFLIKKTTGQRYREFRIKLSGFIHLSFWKKQ